MELYVQPICCQVYVVIDWDALYCKALHSVERCSEAERATVGNVRFPTVP